MKWMSWELGVVVCWISVVIFVVNTFAAVAMLYVIVAVTIVAVIIAVVIVWKVAVTSLRIALTNAVQSFVVRVIDDGCQQKYDA